MMNILFKIIGRGYFMKLDHIATGCCAGQRYNWIEKGKFMEDTRLADKSNDLNAV